MLACFYSFYVIVMLILFFFFFFFQAEDGIRDWSVTGVQTCALPILMWKQSVNSLNYIPDAGFEAATNGFYMTATGALILQPTRSEERRVGKECRYRWSTYH